MFSTSSRCNNILLKNELKGATPVKIFTMESITKIQCLLKLTRKVELVKKLGFLKNRERKLDENVDLQLKKLTH